MLVLSFQLAMHTRIAENKRKAVAWLGILPDSAEAAVDYGSSSKLSSIYRLEAEAGLTPGSPCHPSHFMVGEEQQRVSVFEIVIAS